MIREMERLLISNGCFLSCDAGTWERIAAEPGRDYSCCDLRNVEIDIAAASC